MSLGETSMYRSHQKTNEGVRNEPMSISDRIGMLYTLAAANPGIAIPITLGDHLDQPHLLPGAKNISERTKLETEAIAALVECFSEADPGSSTPLQFGLNGMHISQAVEHIDFGHVEEAVLYQAKLADAVAGSHVQIWAGYSPRGRGISLAFVHVPPQSS